MSGAQAMKRIPRIKFPQRHHKSSGSTPQPQATSTVADPNQILFSRSNVTTPPSTMAGGKASAQPKRTPVSDEEIEAVLLGGCF